MFLYPCERTNTSTGQTQAQGNSCEFIRARPFKYLQCQKYFSTSSGLETHLQTHIGEKLFKCLQCPKSFKTPSHLKSHRLHIGVKLFKCSQCPKSFSQLCDPKTHFQTQCPKSFSQSCDLKTHLQTQCPKSFSQSRDPKIHLQTQLQGSLQHGLKSCILPVAELHQFSQNGRPNADVGGLVETRKCGFQLH